MKKTMLTATFFVLSVFTMHANHNKKQTTKITFPEEKELRSQLVATPPRLQDELIKMFAAQEVPLSKIIGLFDQARDAYLNGIENPADKACVTKYMQQDRERYFMRLLHGQSVEIFNALEINPPQKHYSN